MRSFAVMNQKGGVGKTTTAVNLSAALADSGSRTLLIDLDPQAHASLHLGLSPQPDETSIYDVLIRDARITSATTRVAENLDVATSQIDLAAAEMELAGVVGRELVLRDKLATGAEGYDYVIIDCPPSLGLLTINALCAIEEVLLPMQPHFLALHGLSKLLQTIQLVAGRLNDRLRLAGVVFCMYDSGTRLAAEVAGDVEQFLDESREANTPWSAAQAYKTRVRRNIRLAEAPSFGQSIFSYAPTSPGAEDYRALAAEVAAETTAAPLRRAA